MIGSARCRLSKNTRKIGVVPSASPQPCCLSTWQRPAEPFALLRSSLFAAALCLLVGPAACDRPISAIFQRAKKPEALLQVMSVTWGANLDFERNFLQSFGTRNGVKTQLLSNSRLATYRQLLSAHATGPDMLEVDIVWPSIVADDLVDLRPYLKGHERDFAPQLLDNYVVRGRLIALPVYVDVGILYYRPELLELYGFHKPPETWDELANMARRIQAGERRVGSDDFWGYVWQGSATEGGTCNALEWQSSAGAGNFIESSGKVHVRDPRFAFALRRAADWIGSISPPAEYVYREDDSMNIWNAGQTAFMRNWASGYLMVAEHPGGDHRHFAVAPLPAGPGGHRGTLGGLGMAVSRYAGNRELAIKALLEMTSESNDFQRSLMTGGIPSRSAVLERLDVKSRSLLLEISAALIETAVARPAMVAAEKYDLVSQAYANSVNLVLRKKATPEAALAELETRLAAITGLPAQTN